MRGGLEDLEEEVPHLAAASQEENEEQEMQEHHELPGRLVEEALQAENDMLEQVVGAAMHGAAPDAGNHPGGDDYGEGEHHPGQGAAENQEASQQTPAAQPSVVAQGDPVGQRQLVLERAGGFKRMQKISFAQVPQAPYCRS